MRITNLVANLKSLGETVDDPRVVKKFLRVIRTGGDEYHHRFLANRRESGGGDYLLCSSVDEGVRETVRFGDGSSVEIHGLGSRVIQGR